MLSINHAFAWATPAIFVIFWGGGAEEQNLCFCR